MTEAKPALDRLTDAALPHMPDRALTREERRELPYTSEAQIWDEPYTLPENLFLAFERGMGDRYRDLALRYLQDRALFDPLAAGISPLAGKHAYSHVNALSSAWQAWRHTGEDKYQAAAINGFDMVLDQSYATGGWGPNEELIAAGDPDDLLYRMLSETDRSFETPCGAYGHFKIARSLLAQTGDARYGDSLERVLYNTALGALPTQPNGDTFYYSDYSADGRKGYRGEDWPCCSGTFVQLAADYAISSYMVADDAISVILYAPSTAALTVAGQSVTLRQITEYPLQNTIRIEVSPQAPTRFALNLRIPAWAGLQSRLSINGGVREVPERGAFARLDRVWSPGDVVDLHLAAPMRLEPLNARHPYTVAVLYGPLALFPIEAGDRQFPTEAWLDAERTGSDTWLARHEGQEIRLKPFMSITDETYRLYNELPAG